MDTKLQLPKAVLFDLDNTLATAHNMELVKLQSYCALRGWELPQTVVDAYREAKEEFGFGEFQNRKFPFSDLFTFMTIKNKPIFRQWLGAFKGAKIFDKEFDDYTPQNWSGAYVLLEPEATSPFLSLLKNDGVKLGVVTDAARALAERSAEILPQMDAFVFREDAKRKPHPAPLLLAIEKLGLKPGADIWYMGDQWVDEHCAMLAGCQPFSFDFKTPIITDQEKLKQAGERQQGMQVWRQKEVSEFAQENGIDYVPGPLPILIRQMNELRTLYESLKPQPQRRPESGTRRDAADRKAPRRTP